MKKIRRALVLLAVLWLANWFYPVVFVGWPRLGRVVDAETRAPIAGALVVAAWEVKPKYVEGAPLALAALREGVTGRSGWYWLPGWVKFYLGQAGTLSGQPHKWFMAPGRVIAETFGGVESQFDAVTKRNSMHRRYLTQPLKRIAVGDRAVAEKNLEYVWMSLSLMPRPADRCPWTGVPHTISHLTEARMAMERQGIETTLPSLEQLATERWCEGLLAGPTMPTSAAQRP